MTRSAPNLPFFTPNVSEMSDLFLFIASDRVHKAWMIYFRKLKKSMYYSGVCVWQKLQTHSVLRSLASTHFTSVRDNILSKRKDKLQ